MNPKTLFALLVLLSAVHENSFAQSFLKGILTDSDGSPIEFATVALKKMQDSTVVKVEMTNESGSFEMQGIAPDLYQVEFDLLGYSSIKKSISVTAQGLDMGAIVMAKQSELIDEVTVTAKRSLVEAKSDRMVFNVQGTINSAGENLLNLLRKAPGVLVDNNDNITVLSRSGVLVYVDGKRLPLSGEELSAYLQSIPSEQIDRIDIITNPGAKYEAQGNAGIIDIIMKRDQNLGANGSLSSNISQGRYTTGNVSGTGNYRNKTMNVFASAGLNGGKNYNKIFFENDQNGFLIVEDDNFYRNFRNFNYRLGADYFLSPKSTIGILATGQQAAIDITSSNRSEISRKGFAIDSVLRSDNVSDISRSQQAYNLNYAYRSGSTTLNADVDYGVFQVETDNFQPNLYYNPEETMVLSERINQYYTPVDIGIATAKLDFETNLLGGKFGTGFKVSHVSTDNTFLFYNVFGENEVLNNRRSNNFKYLEKVNALYANYNKSINQAFSFNAGLRMEHTDSKGDLQAFAADLQEDPVTFNYVSLFPTAGVTWQKNPEHVYALRYGRRINRPDYNVLNPFREQITELSFSKGNPFLNPEIVNNVELSYTLKYRMNFTLAYSQTSNQITRLIGPDDSDPRAGFITFANLATQKVYSLNASLPFDITKWWSSYWNASFSQIDNQADYGNGAVVDVQVFNYNFYQSQTFSLPKGWKFEFSGWYSGPGVWGGVFLYEKQYSLDVGLQKRFLDEKLNVKLSGTDLAFTSNWSGVSNFNGLKGTGYGLRDSRRVSLALSYEFGNQNVKSRRRQTGIEAEAGRAGSAQ